MKSFLRGGIHLKDDRKGATASLPIERFVPQEVVLPLSQHLGSPARALVKRKDEVKRGDVIAEADADGAPIHASVSGKVLRVALHPHPTLVEAQAIVIETNKESAEPVWEEVPHWFDLSKEAMLNQIQKAGIVGLGGAAFPTHRKLRLPEGIKVDTLILNGAECEPYLTSDYRTMLEKTSEVLWGATLLARILETKKILIGIEDNKIDVREKLKQEYDNDDGLPIPIQVELCQTRYPQGSEKQLIEALTGRVVPPQKLPFHVGVIVQNVATAVAVYEAIRYHKPLLDRVITVSGKGIVTPKNLSVPIGTLVDSIVGHCGGVHKDTVKVIAGGPMMGKTLGRLDVPVIKGVGGLIFLKKEEIRREEYSPCISCGNCLEACPLGLEPNQISVYTEAGRSLETEMYGTKECFECGCCAFVCPSERPLVQFIQIAKAAFRTGSALGLAVRPGGFRG